MKIYNKRKKLFIIFFVIFIVITLYVIACIISNLLYKKSTVIIDSYKTKIISETELEDFVKVKFTEDCIENVEINLTSSVDNGISMGDWILAPNTYVSIIYELSEDTLNNREYYKENVSTIKGKLTFNKEIYQIINKYGIDENQVEYINTNYGTCVYDITNGVNYADYYMYVVVVKMTDKKYKIFISGTYPYPIALK